MGDIRGRNGAGDPADAGDWRQVTVDFARTRAPLDRFSNDSAFVGEGTFAQRTHLARFGDGERFSLIKKSMHNVFTALSFLGSEQCMTSGLPPGGDFGILATRDGTDRMAILAYHAPEGFDLVNCPEDFDVRHPAVRLRLRLDGVPFPTGRLSESRIDTRTRDARDLWRAMGRPAAPTGRSNRSRAAISSAARLPIPARPGYRPGTASGRSMRGAARALRSAFACRAGATPDGAAHPERRGTLSFAAVLS